MKIFCAIFLVLFPKSALSAENDEIANITHSLSKAFPTFCLLNDAVLNRAKQLEGSNPKLSSKAYILAASREFGFSYKDAFSHLRGITVSKPPAPSRGKKKIIVEEQPFKLQADNLSLFFALRDWKRNNYDDLHASLKVTECFKKYMDSGSGHIVYCLMAALLESGDCEMVKLYDQIEDSGQRRDSAFLKRLLGYEWAEKKTLNPFEQKILQIRLALAPLLEVMHHSSYAQNLPLWVARVPEEKQLVVARWLLDKKCDWCGGNSFLEEEERKRSFAAGLVTKAFHSERVANMNDVLADWIGTNWKETYPAFDLNDLPTIGGTKYCFDKLSAFQNLDNQYQLTRFRAKASYFGMMHLLLGVISWAPDKCAVRSFLEKCDTDAKVVEYLSFVQAGAPSLRISNSLFKVVGERFLSGRVQGEKLNDISRVWQSFCANIALLSEEDKVLGYEISGFHDTLGSYSFKNDPRVKERQEKRKKIDSLASAWRALGESQAYFSLEQLGAMADSNVVMVDGRKYPNISFAPDTSFVSKLFGHLPDAGSWKQDLSDRLSKSPGWWEDVIQFQKKVVNPIGEGPSFDALCQGFFR